MLPKDLLQAIRNLNHPTAPYQIIDALCSVVDLVAEWRIVDTEWYPLFARAGIKKVFRFRTSEIKRPIQETVTRCGWTYRGVAFGKL